MIQYKDDAIGDDEGNMVCSQWSLMNGSITISNRPSPYLLVYWLVKITDDSDDDDDDDDKYSAPLPWLVKKTDDHGDDAEGWEDNVLCISCEKHPNIWQSN